MSEDALQVLRADGPDAGDPLPLPAPLLARYGQLRLPSRLVLANFVSTLDGVVAFEAGAAPSAGSVISGRHPADRTVMALLRTVADAVVVGWATAAPERRHLWTGPALVPGLAGPLAELRANLGLGREPAVYLVSGSGEVDPEAAAVRAGATVVTSRRGEAAARRAAAGPVLVLGEERVDVSRLLAALRSAGHRRVLTEGGPRLFGALLEAGGVDELFLTLSPALAGRAAAPRAGLVAGYAWPARRLARTRLVSLRAAGDLLFARYRLPTTPPSARSRRGESAPPA